MENALPSAHMIPEARVIFLLPTIEETRGDKTEFHSGTHIHPALETLLCCSGHDVKVLPCTRKQGVAYIGVLYYSANNEHGTFAVDAIALAEKGCCGFLIVRSEDERVRGRSPFVESPLLCAYKDSIEVCDAEMIEFLGAAKKIEANARDWKTTIEIRHEKLRQVVAYYSVYDPIGVHLGHGAPTDLANCILAPLRLIANFMQRDVADATPGTFAEVLEKYFGTIEHENSCWTSFKDKMADNGAKLGLMHEPRLNRELQEIVTRLDAQRKAGSGPVVSAVAENAEALMLLLTEFRRNAGVVTDVESKASSNASGSRPTSGAGNSLPVQKASDQSDDDIIAVNEMARPQKMPSSEDSYRLLVVDDHCEYWKPLFGNTAFKDQLEGCLRKPVDICYSQNGLETNNDDVTKKIFSKVTSIVSAAFQCDAVLLDVLIDGVSGLDVLARIREYSNSIPVILWTTTRSQEITNHAQQANGVILKKTCDCKSFVEIIACWLKVGKNRRGTSLLNPFFDSVIKTPEYREYARNVTEWALKWMDGFHATSDYFRIFTDHGGRHYIKILEHLERAIQPFLGGETLVDERYLSCDKDVREQEFLVLYLSVFLHELGMFPIGNEISKRSYKEFAYADCMRELHAPRGMLLLEDDRGEEENRWADKDGWKKICAVKDADIVRKKLAVLVGYHARFYASLKTEAFLDGVVSSKRRQDKGTEALKLRMFEADDPQDIFADCSSRLKEFFEKQANLEKESALQHRNTGDTVYVSNRVGMRDRLRNLAALLRLCDAIDKDESRNPADYLSETGLFVPIEACNRNIGATAAHNKETLKAWVCKYVRVENGRVNMEVKACCPDNELIEAILDVFPLEAGAATSSVDELTDLWNVKYQETEIALEASPLRLNNSLQAWLDCVWRIMAGDDSTEFSCRLRGLLERDGYMTGTKVTEKGIEALMKVSALAAGTEVVDEYAALVETELNKYLRLGEFVWEKNHDRAKESLKHLHKKLSQVPDMLVVVLNGC